jgi:uncharacterized protein involved in exopolysaccharide biosynthesis
MTSDADSRFAELSDRLQTIDAQLEHELVRRGFDPAQVETTALPTALAVLAAERETILEELNALQTDINTNRQTGKEPK